MNKKRFTREEQLAKKRAHNLEWMRKYRSTEKGKEANSAAKKKRHSTPEGREVKREAARRWAKSEKGKECGRKSRKKWNEKNYETKVWPQYLEKKYGITVEQYNAMAAIGCHICGSSDEEQGKLHVDHCHSTGIIRGALCLSCNAGLGHFKDNTDVLLKAISYLMRSR